MANSDVARGIYDIIMDEMRRCKYVPAQRFYHVALSAFSDYPSILQDVRQGLIQRYHASLNVRSFELLLSTSASPVEFAGIWDHILSVKNGLEILKHPQIQCALLRTPFLWSQSRMKDIPGGVMTHITGWLYKLEACGIQIALEAKQTLILEAQRWAIRSPAIPHAAVLILVDRFGYDVLNADLLHKLIQNYSQVPNDEEARVAVHRLWKLSADTAKASHPRIRHALLHFHASSGDIVALEGLLKTSSFSDMVALARWYHLDEKVVPNIDVEEVIRRAAEPFVRPFGAMDAVNYLMGLLNDKRSGGVQQENMRGDLKHIQEELVTERDLEVALQGLSALH
jgi:hypothetical protein